MSDERDPDQEPEKVVIRDNRKIDPVTGQARKPGGSASASTAPGTPAGSTSAAQSETAQSETAQSETAEEADVPKADALLLEERTRDLQRVQAEYANYRRRADRERLAAGEYAVGGALSELLPVLDDIERARSHGDLTGGLKAIAEKLETILTKLGLESFGEVGDPFDPTWHEAVTHSESDSVTEATCTTVLRPGYRHGERLLRAAMVGVTEPVHDPAPVDGPAEEPIAEPAPDEG